MPGIDSQVQLSHESDSGSEILTRLKSLETEFQDGIVTLKGYWKQKCSILEPVLSHDVKDKIGELQSELDNEEITQKGYFKKLDLALAPFLETYKVEMNDGAQETNNGKDVKPEVENGSNGGDDLNSSELENMTRERPETNGAASGDPPKADFKTHIASKLSKFQCGSENGGHTSETNLPPLKAEEDEVPVEINGHVGGSSAEENMSEPSNVSLNDKYKKRDSTEKDEEENEDNGGESESETAPPPKKKSRGSPSSKTPVRRSGRTKVDSSQPAITSMFARRTKPETAAGGADCEKANSDDEDNCNKRQKIDNGDKKQDTCNAVSINSPMVDREKCKECLKFLDDPELKLFPGDPTDALEECLALIDGRLNLFTGDEDPDKLMDETPLHKVTNFSVYDKHRHMCPFDMGLIESNKLLYFSGVLKPIFEDNPSPDDGVPCGDMGPINEWHIAGFDGGERSLIGFNTGYGTYYLMEPSEAYAPVMEHVKVKVHLAKIVIEFVMNNEEATYEDLLNKIQTTVPPPGINSVSEDSLLRHAQFVVDRIQSFDDAANDEDLILLTTPCIRSLINLAGVTLGKK